MKTPQKIRGIGLWLACYFGVWAIAESTGDLLPAWWWATTCLALGGILVCLILLLSCHETVATPNDPKLSDRSRSLERMVRRLCVADVHAILTKFIEMGEADSPVFVEIDDMEVPIRSVSQRMAEKHVKFCGRMKSPTAPRPT